jgi:hypothetical protein
MYSLVMVHFTLYCTVAACFCLHTGGIRVSQDESLLCDHVLDVHDVFIVPIQLPFPLEPSVNSVYHLL